MLQIVTVCVIVFCGLLNITQNYFFFIIKYKTSGLFLHSKR